MSVNVGDDIFAATMNRLLNPPMCRLVQFTAGQNIVDNTNTALTWDTEDYDDLGMHSPSVNPTRITITSAAGDGKYEFKGTFFVPARADYVTIGVVVAKNGTNQPPWERNSPGANAQRTVSTSATIPMVVGDYAELVAYQDNTANATVTTPFGSAFEPVFECIKVSD